MDWFSVDKEGLAALLERRGKTHAVLELLQNAFDEKGVTEVIVNLDRSPAGKRGRSLLTVTDNSPDGFADLTHAFTLFAPSKKVHDATQRGRFNFGEKLVLAICDEATVISTTGGYRFNLHGRHTIRTKREHGSQFSATIRLTAEDRREFDDLIQTILVPSGIRLVYNGDIIHHRRPVREFETVLRTEVADDEGVLRPSARKTTVRLFDPVGDEVPTIYEMGIPVVEHDGRWHIDVGQKVPLSFNRDNVTPAYAQDLRVAVLNEARDLLEKDDAATGWVRSAVGDGRADQQSVVTVFKHRFGDRAVAFDPSDPEANQEAVLHGYTVVPGGALTREEWQQVKEHGVLRPAGQVTPSRQILTAPDGTPPIERAKWTPGMVRMADYARALAKELLGVEAHVDFQRSTQFYGASWGKGGHLTYNLMRLGHRWFDEPDPIRVDALLLHEFAHERVSDHLSEAFHVEIARLGARLRDVAIRL